MGGEAWGETFSGPGVNYYFRMKVAADAKVATLGFSQVPVEAAQTTSLGWEVYPQGLEDILMRLTKEYEVAALYVMESGSAWHDEPDANGYVADHERVAYLLDHIDAMANAAAQGAPMRGYFAWSLMDNFEWSYGFWPRFGLACVDYQTQSRTLKLSAGTYRQLIAEHREATRRSRLGAAPS